MKELAKKIKRMLEVSTKPSREDFFQAVKITLLGLSLVGAITYVIQLIVLVLQLRPR